MNQFHVDIVKLWTHCGVYPLDFSPEILKDIVTVRNFKAVEQLFKVICICPKLDETKSLCLVLISLLNGIEFSWREMINGRRFLILKFSKRKLRFRQWH